MICILQLINQFLLRSRAVLATTSDDYIYNITLCTCMHICTHMYTHTCMHIYKRAHVHMRTHIQTHMYVYVYTHTVGFTFSHSNNNQVSVIVDHLRL